MDRLSTFLPALLDAFENHSPYVHKAIIVCLVDTYLKLGPAWLRQQAVAGKIHCSERLMQAGRGRGRGRGRRDVDVSRQGQCTTHPPFTPMAAPEQKEGHSSWLPIYEDRLWQ